MYGESAVVQQARNCDFGLSPRVRGIRPAGAQLCARLGSIPACTGNPSSRPPPPVRQTVYPRVYGESMIVMADLSVAEGLSPRVRGIHLDGEVAGRGRGSIPACTGNPGGGRGARARGGVYPRVYGESCATPYPRTRTLGLSPRVRGILRQPPASVVGRGSIPACTGNPSARTPGKERARVYPRVYGESPSIHG